MTGDFRSCPNCGAELWIIRGEGTESFAVDAQPLLEAEAHGILIYTTPGGGTKGRALGRGGVWRTHRCANPALQKSRPTDPSGSRRASQENVVRRKNQRGRIVRVLVEADVPLLPDDIVARTGIPLNSVTTRLSELVRGGWADEVSHRQTQRGGSGTTYRASEKARRTPLD